METPPTSTPLSCLTAVVGSDHSTANREFHFGNIEVDDDDDDDDRGVKRLGQGARLDMRFMTTTTCRDRRRCGGGST